MTDINSIVAGWLRDLAFVQTSPHSRWGSKRAASAVLYLDVPIDTLLKPDGTLRPADEIAGVFAAAGIDVSKPVITSCGSGITAAILTLGLTLAGRRDHAVYDGSWTEWGSTPDRPVATGP